MNRDNQAGKIDVIGWIAGFFDADGYVGLWKRNDKRKKHYKDTYRPTVCLSNTDKKTIDYLSEQLKLFHIPHYISSTKQKKWKCCYSIKIQGFRRLKKFIDFIENYVVTKREQILLAKEFIESRASVHKNTPYTKREHEIYKQLKYLKHK